MSAVPRDLIGDQGSLRRDLRAADAANSSEGELLSISERLVVAPTWGRLRKNDIERGQRLPTGSVIGSLWESGKEISLVLHAAGAFLGWLAVDGERVPPGRAIARFSNVEE